ncbi:MAG: AAA family ATPase [Mesorhizobium sp.]|uniref:AAA family ATPase n=1 Tax=Mesorhizobium sp. TaxID=1871066 RepID=UPI000FE8A35B|nr:AAA family ATPase [Mesorhizobium sp.]RWC36156.1 MAG: AAA family ATPase [Mesorhizobium sp.]
MDTKAANNSPAALAAAAQQLLEAGHLTPVVKLNSYYATFQDLFGPVRLGALDGPELLERMHAHGTGDSLVYWLEFKDDEEFPAIFGSIAGGSALKFGLYRSRETGQWMTGSSRDQRPITESQAVEIARRHRDQLIEATRVLDRFAPPEGSTEDIDQAYRHLQASIMQVAPDVANLAWGHKYLSLYAPNKLDDYHSEEFQRFHLIKLLQLPPEPRGRYVCAGRFIELARAADLPINHLTTVLNQINGRPYRYWRIGTTISGRHVWADMREGGFAAIGWADLPDLSDLKHDRASKERVAEMLSAAGDNGAVATRKAGEILDFVADIRTGDVAVAADGERILGIGRVSGNYEHRPDRLLDAPHQRAVQWLDIEPWKLSGSEGLRTTIWQFANPNSQLEFEKSIQSSPGPITSQVRRAASISEPPEPMIEEINAILRRKGQVILYGPPGTGKTYWARRAALDLAARDVFGKPFAHLGKDQRAELEGHGGLVRMVTFHPGFGYEDFIEGFRPQAASGQLSFELRDGVFKGLCDKARADGRPHYLVIDEINRGDIPRIFGELITLLEADKRGLEVTLPSGRVLSVPKNLLVIGTMNTADRSIALLDVALRRRFGFVELLPEISRLHSVVIGGRLPLARWLDALNAAIRSSLGRDARSLQIGHAFFLEEGKPVADPGRFAAVVAGEVAPLLQEYCYEDYSVLHRLVGGLVDMTLQRIRTELFAPGRTSELLTALLEPFPDLTASAEAVAQDLEAAQLDDDLGEPDE